MNECIFECFSMWADLRFKEVWVDKAPNDKESKIKLKSVTMTFFSFKLKVNIIVWYTKKA